MRKYWKMKKKISVGEAHFSTLLHQFIRSFTFFEWTSNNPIIFSVFLSSFLNAGQMCVTNYSILKFLFAHIIPRIGNI